MPFTLREVDSTKNMAWFYSLEVHRDLLGRTVPARCWGRIGTAGKIRLDKHAGECEALAALRALQILKMRKGYGS